MKNHNSSHPTNDESHDNSKVQQAQILSEAQAIVSRLSLRDKIALVSGKDMWHMKAVPSSVHDDSHEDIPSICVTDGPHGLRKQQDGGSVTLLDGRVDATCFPTASCMASSFDVDLLHQVGQALADECLEHHVSILLGPGLNIKRHVCGGRNFEYFSEDPFVSGTLAASLVRGIQSRGVGACIKHVCVNNQEHNRMRVDVLVDERTLREVYLRGFEMVVKEANPYAIMCSYNKLNGVYCSEHERLWQSMVREEWGYEGMVMTDWGAMNDRVRALRAGVDLEMPGSHGAFDTQVLEAVESGDLSEDLLNRSVVRNVSASLRGRELWKETRSDTKADLDAHHELARRVAMGSAVLLKNEENVLPLAHNAKIVLFGDLAEAPRYQGMGSSQVKAYKVDSALDRFRECASSVEYIKGGYDIPKEDLRQAASTADVAVVFVGMPEVFESEGMDRSHIHLPFEHNNLVDAVCACHSRVVVVLTYGAPVAMPWVDQPQSILTGYLAGQAGGSALVDLMFGVESPSGKLAETYPIRVEDQLSHAWFPGNDHVEYREGLNIGYRGFDAAETPVLFPFGHGMTYARFGFSKLRSKVISDPFSVSVSIAIRNCGSTRAAEVVQCYVHDCDSTVYRPPQELKAFAKVWLNPGEARNVDFRLDRDAFSFYDVGSETWVVEPGKFELRVGSSSRDIRQSMTIDVAVGDTPSRQARVLYPPNALLVAADDDFCRMLGISSLPHPELDLWPYHLNTRVRDLQISMLGRFFASFLKGQATAALPAELRENDAHVEMVHQVMDYMPLRGLVLFSKGQMSFEDLQLLLAILNHSCWKMLLQLWPVIRTKLLQTSPPRR